ncbi:MAG: CBS domain-containing protein [Candidatus Omnitrophica bacterium]|nr:CBS domain-containing protein [Candidatus Omnitrophota bacterium]
MDSVKLQSILVSADMSIKEAMQKLDYTAERILFVVEEGNKLVGTVTDGDIRRGIIHGCAFKDGISKLMRRDFVKVDSDMDNLMYHVKEIMFNDKLEQIPIVNRDGVIEDMIRWIDIFDKDVVPLQAALKSNPVVIMAGGKGLRLDPFTKILPKPLIPIGDKTVIELIMEKFYKHGFHNFNYTLNYKKEYIKIFLQENDFSSYKLNWVEEKNYLGTIGSLSLLREKLKETFFVTNCDSLLAADFAQLLKWHSQYDAAITIVGCHNEVKIPFGVLEVSDGKLKKMVEKPVHDVIINTGVYVIEPRVLSYIPDNKKMDINELIETVAKKDKVSVYTIFSGWFDIGQWEEYKDSLKQLGI